MSEDRPESPQQRHETAEPATPAPSGRKRREAEALRANLARRKAQQRGRRGSGDDHDPDR